MLEGVQIPAKRIYYSGAYYAEETTIFANIYVYVSVKADSLLCVEKKVLHVRVVMTYDGGTLLKCCIVSMGYKHSIIYNDVACGTTNGSLWIICYA